MHDWMKPSGTPRCLCAAWRCASTFFAALLLSVLFAFPAPAATGLDVLDRERGRERTEPRSLPKVRISEDRIFSPQDAAAQFFLGSLSISGATVFSEAELLAPYAHLKGALVSFAAVNGIAADLTKQYRDAGYLLSRVILPAQEVDQHSAHIRLNAVEGFISSIEYSGDERVLERFKSWFAPAEQRLIGKKPLKHSDFERQMLLLQDLPGIRASSRFQEGSSPGASILILDVQGDLLEMSAGWGNTGTKSAGPGMVSLNAGVNTLPVIGARTAIAYSQANKFQEYWSLQVTESYRMWNGLSFKASYAFSESQRQDTEFARLFDYETNSHTVNLGASYPLLRGRDMNVSLGLNYEHRDSDAFTLDERFTRDRLRALSANADFDFSDTLGGVTQVIPTLSRGLNLFDATHKHYEATNTLAPAEFWKLDIYVSRNQQLPYNFSLFAAAEAQFADSSLSSYNRFSFGGGQFGRGYEPGAIEGDNAFAVSLEPRWTCSLSDTTAIQPFAFIDWGTVWASRSVRGMPDEQRGSSFGAGLRLWGHVGESYLPDFNFSAFVAKPLQRIRANRGDDPRFVVQATLFF